MATTFGLRNHRGSCWVNAALQSIFRIPDLQERFDEGNEDDKNPVEMCLSEIWSSRGDEGLKDFFEAVKTSNLPAGEDIGDSHELIEFLCDKVPFLDKLFRFNVVQRIKCNGCDYIENRKDSMIEFSIVSDDKEQTVSKCIAEAVQPSKIEGWRCDKCKQACGCTKQLLLVDFPQIMMFHRTNDKRHNKIQYSPVINVNGNKYALFSIVCYTGGHWMTWGRDLPPGKPWYKFDDTHVQSYDAKHFPLVDTMRLLMYYRINE